MSGLERIETQSQKHFMSALCLQLTIAKSVLATVNVDLNLIECDFEMSAFTFIDTNSYSVFTTAFSFIRCLLIINLMAVLSPKLPPGN